jgi:predicted metal-dependent phosphotriesterase family hydrolase
LPLARAVDIVPRLLEAGATQEQIEGLLVDYPRRYFSGEAE